MEARLYVGNLSYDTTENELRELFAQAGTVEAVDLIKDRDSGLSKGFAFVTMLASSEAESAIAMLDGQEVGGRNLRVSLARPREDRPGGGGRGGFDRGGGRGSDRGNRRY
jgi:cold-inducible RNA-binding protein